MQLSRLFVPVSLGLLVMACSPDATQAPQSIEQQAEIKLDPIRTWQQLAVKGSGPIGINASAYAPGLNAIFAAAMPDYGPGELWRFDLKTDRWTRLTAENWPIGKYRTLTYDSRNRRLVTYWNGVGQVYTIPDQGGSWTAEGSAPNQEDSYEGYAFYNPVSQRLTTFAGYGWGAWNNVLREWVPESNTWTTLTQANAGPSPRFGYGASSVAVDISGRRAFLGQRSLGAADGKVDDLWQLDLRTNRWTSLIGPSTGSQARVASAFAYAAERRLLYRFGGCGPLVGSANCSTYTNELLVMSPDLPWIGWVQVPRWGGSPGGRAVSGFYYDAPRNRLILLSGNDGTTWQDDVWAFDFR